MRGKVRLALVGCSLAVIAGSAAMGVCAAAPPDHANQINVTFREAPVLITDHVHDLGIRQLIVTSTGTLDGFGTVTELTSVTQDMAVHPCGPGSSSESATRRIVASGGALVLREAGLQCITASGPIFHGTYVIDGNGSTGIFASAQGSGAVTVDVATHTTTLSGRLNLAESTRPLPRPSRADAGVGGSGSW